VKKNKNNAKLSLNKVSIADLDKIGFIEMVRVSPTKMKHIYGEVDFTTVKTEIGKTCISYETECELPV